MTSHTRPWLAIVAAIALSLVPMNDALAKKDKKSKGKEVPENIELTGLKSFDNVFGEIADIDARLDKAEKALRTAKRDLNTALALEKGTPLKDAIADLQKKSEGKVKVALKGKQPQLEASDAVPQNITDALTAVNGLTAALVVSVEELASIPGEVKSLQKKTLKFPEKLKSEVLDNPTMSIKDIPKTLKVLKGNTVVTAGLPQRSTKVSGRAVSLLEVVAGGFPAGAAADGGGDDNAEAGAEKGEDGATGEGAAASDAPKSPAKRPEDGNTGRRRDADGNVISEKQ